MQVFQLTNWYISRTHTKFIYILCITHHCRKLYASDIRLQALPPATVLFSFAGMLLVRKAYTNWTRPASFSGSETCRFPVLLACKIPLICFKHLWKTCLFWNVSLCDAVPRRYESICWHRSAMLEFALFICICAINAFYIMCISQALSKDDKIFIISPIFVLPSCPLHLPVTQAFYHHRCSVPTVLLEFPLLVYQVHAAEFVRRAIIAL